MKIFFVEPPPSHKKTSLTGVSVDVRSDGLPMKCSSYIRRTSWRRLRPGECEHTRGAGTYRSIASHRFGCVRPAALAFVSMQSVRTSVMAWQRKMSRPVSAVRQPVVFGHGWL